MELNEDTFLIIAMKYYDNPSCSGLVEFQDDLKKFKYLRKLFKRKSKNNLLNVKLTLNHIITLYNIFGNKATELLFFKIDKEHWTYLKPFLIFLNFMPERIVLNNETILSSDVVMNDEIIKELRKI